MKKVSVLPLFDRLIDENPDASFEVSARRFISFDELKESITKDLTLLLNTKISPFWVDYSKTMKIPFSYGINSTAPSSAETVFEIQDLENRIKQVISTFEPRLKNVQVQILTMGVTPGKADVQIDADVVADNLRVPLSFSIVMET